MYTKTTPRTMLNLRKPRSIAVNELPSSRESSKTAGSQTCTRGTNDAEDNTPSANEDTREQISSQGEPNWLISMADSMRSDIVRSQRETT